MSSVYFYKLSHEKNNNFSLTRWFLYLQEESDKFSGLSARILSDNILSFASSEWHTHLTKGQANKVQKLQHSYLTKVNTIVKKFLTDETEKK